MVPSTDQPDDGPRIREERPDPAVARLVLARPHARNAQDKRMLYELDAAYLRATADDAVRVIILAADGPSFSAGHDLREAFMVDPAEQVGTWCGYGLPGVEGWLASERELFVGLCRRWRDLPKPTIAQVQGKVIAAGLMLVWPCDLIIAADDAEFSDPVVVFGCNGHEYFTHPWELGPRKAKELLFTGGTLSAPEARALGMVNHVVPRTELEPFTLSLAQRIALRPSIGLKLAKMSVNQTLDIQGQQAAVDAAHSLHQLGHAHNQQLYGRLVDPAGARIIREGR